MQSGCLDSRGMVMPYAIGLRGRWSCCDCWFIHPLHIVLSAFRGIAFVALPRSSSHGAFGALALPCTPARLLLAGFNEVA